MDIKELENALNKAVFMKRTIDENTDAIAERVKSWCLNEYRWLDAEKRKLHDFLRSNNEIFSLDNGFKVYYPYYKKSVYNDRFMAHFYSDGRTYAELTPSNKSLSVVGEFTKLPAPDKVDYDLSSMTSEIKTPDTNCSDIDYWVDYRKYLAIYREYFETLVKSVKSGIDEITEKQQMRFDEIAKTCGEIDRDEGKTVEVTIRISRTRN
jgi:hypothetical protein